MMRFHFCILLLTATSLAQPAWRPLSGPPGGAVFAILSDGDRMLYARAAEALYRSSDDGDTWVRASGFPGDQWNAVNRGMLAAPGGVLVASREHRDSSVIRSTGHGETWHPVVGGSLETAVSGRRPFVVDPLTGVMYVATVGGVLRSNDRGATWRMFGPRPSGSDLVFVGRSLYAICNGRVIRFGNEPGPGSEYTAPPGSNAASSLFVSPGGFVFARFGGVGAGWYRTADAPIAWSRVAMPIDPDWIDFRGDDTLVAYGTGGRYRSVDGGFTWTTVDGSASMKISAVVRDARGRIFGAGLIGPVRSTDDGATWMLANTGMSSASIRQIEFDRGSLYVVSSGGYHRSDDRGLSWIRLNDPNAGQTGVAGARIALSSSGALFVGGGALHRSTDRGETWQAVDTSVQGVAALTAGDGIVLYTDGHGRLHRFDERTLMVMRRVAGAAPVAGPMSLDVRGRLHACSYLGLLSSLDTGRTWRLVVSSIAPYVLTCASDGSIYIANDDTLHYSSGGDSQWQSWTLPRIIDGTVSDIEPDGVGGAYIASRSAIGVIHTDLGAGSWLAMHRGLRSKPLTLARDDRGAVYAGTEEDGLYVTDGVSIASPDMHATGHGRDITILPNPLHDRARVTFVLAHAGRVAVTLHDALGRLVRTIAVGDEPMGEVTHTMEVSDLPAGIYLVRVERTGECSSLPVIVGK